MYSRWITPSATPECRAAFLERGQLTQEQRQENVPRRGNSLLQRLNAEPPLPGVLASTIIRHLEK
jgi:hypothetical protein